MDLLPSGRFLMEEFYYAGGLPAVLRRLGENGLLPHPGRIGIELPVNLPRPRDQLSTREHPEFLRLRRQLFDFIKATEQ